VRSSDMWVRLIMYGIASWSMSGKTHLSRTTRPAWAGTAPKPILRRRATAARYHGRLHREQVPVSRELVDLRPLRAHPRQIFPPRRRGTAPRGVRVLSLVVGNERAPSPLVGIDGTGDYVIVVCVWQCWEARSTLSLQWRNKRRTRVRHDLRF